MILGQRIPEDDVTIMLQDIEGSEYLGLHAPKSIQPQAFYLFSEAFLRIFDYSIALITQSTVSECVFHI